MIFPKHFTLNGHGYSGGGIHAYIGNLEREPTNVRIAFKRDSDLRWKMSGRMTLAVASLYIEKLSRSMMLGLGVAHFLHDIKTHHRETIRHQLRKHRSKQAMVRELRSVEELPTFGMF